MATWQGEVMLDRITMNRLISNKEDHIGMYGILLEWKYDPKLVVPGGMIRMNNESSEWVKRLDYYPVASETNRKILDIKSGIPKLFGSKEYYRYFSITLYPTKFRAGEFEKFKDTFNCLFDPYDYEDFYSNGKAKHVEFSLDTTSQEYLSFIPYKKRSQKSYVHLLNEPNPIGTTYVGSSKGDLFFKIYDKKKQLEEEDKFYVEGVSPENFPCLTRIEATINNPKAPASGLDQIENPFKKISIVDVKEAKALNSDPEWQKFINNCLTQGASSALSPLSSYNRKKYLSALDSIPAKWWNPDERWSGVEKALEIIKP